MTIWLNGPHGIRRSRTADVVAARIPGTRVVDPEPATGVRAAGRPAEPGARGSDRP